MKKPFEPWALVTSLALVFLVGAFGAIFSGAGDWYTSLNKPVFTPPSWLFGPVWTILYIMMAVAAWLVWRERANTPVEPVLAAYCVQLALNAAWSWLFFGMQAIGMGLIDIVLLALVLALTVAMFWKVRAAAGALLVPYLLWVCFAAALNLRIWQLNP